MKKTKKKLIIENAIIKIKKNTNFCIGNKIAFLTIL